MSKEVEKIIKLILSDDEATQELGCMMAVSQGLRVEVLECIENDIIEPFGLDEYNYDVNFTIEVLQKELNISTTFRSNTFQWHPQLFEKHETLRIDFFNGRSGGYIDDDSEENINKAKAYLKLKSYE